MKFKIYCPKGILELTEYTSKMLENSIGLYLNKEMSNEEVQEFLNSYIFKIVRKNKWEQFGRFEEYEAELYSGHLLNYPCWYNLYINHTGYEWDKITEICPDPETGILYRYTL